jgi:putative ABC transport system ATP-binding protein
MSEQSIIQIRQLTKNYRVGDVDVHALRGVDLDVVKGEFIAVVGSSGSGKSTLFNVLGGLTSPSGGSVHVNGKDLSHMTNSERTNLRKNTVGFIFQKYNLLPTLSAEDNIRIVKYIGGHNTDFDASFKDVLNVLGIADRLKHKPRALSGGQQQRVAIARAIVNEPAILLADEPTGNLDSQNSAVVLKILKRLNEQMGQTILMITHDEEAAEFAHRRVHMKDGKLVSAPPKV